MILLAAYNALRSPIPVPDPLTALLPGLGYDALVAALLGPLVISIHDRRVESERLDW
jgi:hypothetical protein